MPSHRLTQPAEQDVVDIWLHVAADSIDAADRLVDRFTEAYGLLALNPELGEKMDQYRSGLRAWPVGRYVVYYRRSSEGIEVYRVLHGARDAGPLL